MKNGFEIVDKNFSSKFGEIDIIALKDGVLHFVEVKSGENFNPIYALTPKKMERILKTARLYILKHKIIMPYCVDLVCLSGKEFANIEFLENVSF